MKTSKEEIWKLTLVIIKIVACNGSNTLMQAYVVGGGFAEIEQFPHAVFLHGRCFEDESSHICGSSILNQRILLTAAHCLDSCRKGASVLAIAGNSDLSKASVSRKIKRYLLHEEYDSFTGYCDIALAMTDSNFPFGKAIKKVWIGLSFPMGSFGTVAGWGSINNLGQSTKKLKQLWQTVVDPKHCAEYAGAFMLWGTMCASSGSDTDHPGSGDSGSALVLGNFQQIGIVSRAGADADIAIHMNVSSYYYWIQHKTKHLFCAGK